MSTDRPRTPTLAESMHHDHRYGFHEMQADPRCQRCCEVCAGGLEVEATSLLIPVTQTLPCPRCCT